MDRIGKYLGGALAVLAVLMLVAPTARADEIVWGVSAVSGTARLRQGREQWHVGDPQPPHHRVQSRAAGCLAGDSPTADRSEADRSGDEDDCS